MTTLGKPYTKSKKLYINRKKATEIQWLSMYMGFRGTFKVCYWRGGNSGRLIITEEWEFHSRNRVRGVSRHNVNGRLYNKIPEFVNEMKCISNGNRRQTNIRQIRNMYNEVN